MRTKIFRKFEALTLLVVFVSTQCMEQHNVQTPEDATPSLASTSNPTVAPSPIAPWTPSDATAVDLPNFIGVKQGQYILVQTNMDGNEYLLLISTDKTIVRKFFSDAVVDTSSDGKQLLIMKPQSNRSYLYDLVTGKRTVLTINRDCLNASWSSDTQYITLSCVNDLAGEIYILDTSSHSLVQITDCVEKEESCIDPSWSFDNQWLAYYRYDQRSGVHPRGIYVFNTTCLENDSCMAEQIGPIEAESNAVWSIDSELIFANHGEIEFFKNDNREFVQTKKVDTGIDYLNYLEYSPDGEYLIYTSNHDAILNLYILSAGVSEEVFRSNSPIQIIGWIVVN